MLLDRGFPPFVTAFSDVTHTNVISSVHEVLFEPESVVVGCPGEAFTVLGCGTFEFHVYDGSVQIVQVLFITEFRIVASLIMAMPISEYPGFHSLSKGIVRLQFMQPTGHIIKKYRLALYFTQERLSFRVEKEFILQFSLCTQVSQSGCFRRRNLFQGIGFVCRRGKGNRCPPPMWGIEDSADFINFRIQLVHSGVNGRVKLHWPSSCKEPKTNLPIVSCGST